MSALGHDVPIEAAVDKELRRLLRRRRGKSCVHVVERHAEVFGDVDEFDVVTDPFALAELLSIRRR